MQSTASVIMAVVVFGLAIGGLTLSGCGGGGLETKEIQGAVTVGGQPVEMGSVRFVPIEGTKGPVGAARIENGRYHVISRGGVPLGKHRVEVIAQRKTGRMIPGFIEGEKVEEILSISPEKYSGANSPLVFELTEKSDVAFDIELPALRRK